MKPIILGSAILLLLPVAHALAPNYLFFLPLGGSTISEMGIVLGLCVAVSAIQRLLDEANDKKNADNDHS
jgi:hypothetical protein